MYADAVLCRLRSPWEHLSTELSPPAHLHVSQRRILLVVRLDNQPHHCVRSARVLVAVVGPNSLPCTPNSRASVYGAGMCAIECLHAMALVWVANESIDMSPTLHSTLDQLLHLKLATDLSTAASACTVHQVYVRIGEDNYQR